MSAVSSRLIPRSSARWIVATDSSSSISPYQADIPMQPRPCAETTSPCPSVRVFMGPTVAKGASSNTCTVQIADAVRGRHHMLTWGGPVQNTNRIPRDYRWWALAAAMLVMFTASLSATIVSTAAPTIVADLNGFSLYGWVITAYMLASTVSV